MVDGGGRCGCQQDEFDPEADVEGDPPPACCSPQVFTSVLLGVLACVLMTGGVFLAFHRWDPLWLIVSGIGVLLILIGSILHCCGSSPDNSRTRHRGPAGKGGCCGGRPHPDHLHHGHHLVTNNGSLTEQLLPLSNARSVSQLSLNMLPGYFPPVVTTYGIEQHSAVVQNINRLVQQQQSPAPGSPGGKSFILLSLPPGSDPTQQQNLVGYTVYQLDESSAMESPTPESTPTTPATTTTVPSPTVPTTSPVRPTLFKSVEVQTCHVWPIVSSGISQNASSSNSSTQLTPDVIQNNKPSQNASCSSSTEATSSEIIQNSNNLVPNSSPPQIITNNHMQKTSSSKSSSIMATSEVTHNSLTESVTPEVGRNHNVQKLASGKFATKPSTSGISPLQKSCCNNSSADLHQPSTSQTEDATNCCTAGIPPVCDNVKSSGGVVQSAQSPRTLQNTSVSEASSPVLVDISEPIVDDSLLVVAIPESSTDNLNLLELATPPTTGTLVDTAMSCDVIPTSATSIDANAISTILSDISSVSVTSVDVPPLPMASLDVPPTSETVVPTSIASSDIPAVPSDVSIATSDDTASSSEITTSSGIATASNDSTENTTHQTSSDIAGDHLQVGASRSDLSLSNLSDMDGEVDDNELDRFSPPPSYDDAINEGETAIGAFGLAYGTI